MGSKGYAEQVSPKVRKTEAEEDLDVELGFVIMEKVI